MIAFDKAKSKPETGALTLSLPPSPRPSTCVVQRTLLLLKLQRYAHPFVHIRCSMHKPSQHWAGEQFSSSSHCASRPPNKHQLFRRAQSMGRRWLGAWIAPTGPQAMKNAQARAEAKILRRLERPRFQEIQETETRVWRKSSSDSDLLSSSRQISVMFQVWP